MRIAVVFSTSLTIQRILAAHSIMATSTQPRIAVLDDYNGLAPRYLASLSNASVTVYRDTILPADDLDGLVDRLGGYDVLVTMRERTPITKDLISRLPKLRVILTTGMRNKGIDLDACRDAGVKVYGTPGESLGQVLQLRPQHYRHADC